MNDAKFDSVLNFGLLSDAYAQSFECDNANNWFAGARFFLLNVRALFSHRNPGSFQRAVPGSTRILNESVAI